MNEGGGSRPETTPTGTLVLRRAALSIRVRIRTLIVGACLVAAIVLLGVTALCVGSLVLSPGEVLAALLGQGDSRSQLVVMEWRLPRVLAAVVFGAALGASGALFQSLTRNPLGSPDVLGFDAGAVTGALVATLVLGAGQTGLTIGALVGGLATAVVVAAFGLSSGSGSIRLIVVGIGMSAMLLAINQLLIQRAELEEAMRASSWTLGSLASIGWERLVPATCVIAVLLVLAVLAARPGRMLELHNDAAAAFGVSVRPVRLALLAIGVALVAVPVAVAGPIAFVALTAPHLARQLTRVGPLAVLPAALMGSLVLLGADVAVLVAPTTSSLPVSIATLVLGGSYFIWLLINEWRHAR
ncbi:iron chelate uptake ABC transporter family permease subunit [Pseudoclavibacter sp. AY1H1]|uniref:FecCD family ABC transporter permease n=1 Tax=Pseudoclavibacter sp. AY1H1 TaxID=2080584 RepID=UPI000CE8AED8|nr:iron chelate uptake ABC transporter family permease subunit [Pseudoclavibacter sp. AY1H1]PPF37081.1 iron-enterobactin ABC transporter permease [Pseudoclavibacter sp. AY1H1]